ncbi:ATP-binding cassette domain-containing protein [Thiohalocapsa marina]|uniref:ATP-binding cassette domain-containing protein n=1 Tax=Thiohalocapsa marina TaxID=424902 RepID=A0A5M8FEA8_9GAMM|nr:ATP-binding cassette domain-containing protein [Thiohalocapsa marina]KAA6182979.1 ATP-binding cassette domain-containing protein [Thiohalocapsa marina]
MPKPAESPAAADAGPLLRVHALQAGHARPVVGPLSFEIARGEVVGLWGRNGSGKSTLLQAIGHGARIFGGRIERAPGTRVAYQEQRPVRLSASPLTGLDLLRAAGPAADDRPVHRRQRGRPALPTPLAALLRQRLDRLSGGQYQLLGVWAALQGAADLVLLDEPTNNLDPHHETLLVDFLKADADRRGVLLVSHERGFLDASCSRILEIGT